MLAAAGLIMVFLAGLLRGFTGFGFSIAAVPMLSLILAPVQVVPLVLLLQVAITLAGLLAGRAGAAADRGDVPVARPLPRPYGAPQPHAARARGVDGHAGGAVSARLPLAARAGGVRLEPGDVFVADPGVGRSHLRLGFSEIRTDRIAPELERLAAAFSDLER